MKIGCARNVTTNIRTLRTNTTMKDNTEDPHKHCHASSHCGCLCNTSANSRCSDSAGSRTDTERLDWIERKQLSGEFLYDAIHWDGRVFRECIDEAIDEENNEIGQSEEQPTK